MPVFLGWLISFLNTVTGSYIIYRAFRTAGKGFFNTVLLSMVVRMFVISGIVFILVFFFRVEKFSLAISMFLFYFLFLIMEINLLNKNRQTEKA